MVDALFVVFQGSWQNSMWAADILMCNYLWPDSVASGQCLGFLSEIKQICLWIWPLWREYQQRHSKEKINMFCYIKEEVDRSIDLRSNWTTQLAQMRGSCGRLVVIHGVLERIWWLVFCSGTHTDHCKKRGLFIWQGILITAVTCTCIWCKHDKILISIKYLIRGFK
jgi:hypothetical protein